MSTIAELRTTANLTQQELADLSGVAQSNIAAYESGRRRPSPAMVARLAAAARPRPSVALERARAEVLEAAHRRSAVALHVFGSVARGEDRPGSDLDLLVEFAAEATLFDQVELEEDLRDILGVDVDVVSAGGDVPDEIRRSSRPL